LQSGNKDLDEWLDDEFHEYLINRQRLECGRRDQWVQRRRNVPARFDPEMLKEIFGVSPTG